MKNYLLYASRSLDVEEFASDELGKEVNRDWGSILGSLMGAGLGSRGYEDQLLHMHWIKQHDPLAKNWNGVKSVKGRFGLRRYAERHADLLVDLRGYVLPQGIGSLGRASGGRWTSATWTAPGRGTSSRTPTRWTATSWTV